MTQTIIRGYRADDLQAVVDIYNAVEDAIGVERWATPFILQSRIESQINPAGDAFVIESDGRLIGFALYELMATSGSVWARGIVHPDFWGRGIGTQLVQLTEAHIIKRAEAELPADIPIMVDRYIDQANQRAPRLMEAQGYWHVLTTYEMRIELDQPIEALPLPGQLVLRAFTPEQAQAVYAANNEAFAENRDHVEMSFEEWSHMRLSGADVDTSLWQIAYAGDEVAGFALSQLDDPEGKAIYITIFGVRRPWRRQGLGVALLKLSFAAFQARGAVRASLYVDSSNKTNAVGLYQRAGMHIHTSVMLYRKMLRGDSPEVG